MFRLPRASVDILTGVLIVIGFALFILALRNPTSLDDGLRHFAMAEQLRDRGITNIDGWNIFFYQGYLSRVHVDPWFLSDVLMIPFTYFPLAMGLHLFVIAEFTLLVASFLLVLRHFSLRPAAASVFLMLLVFGDQQFMGRFLFGRPYALMTSMTLLVLWAVLERRWLWVAALMAMSVLLSQLFVFPLLVCACAFLVHFLSAKKHDAMSLLIAASAGAIAGFLLHPHAMEYASYFTTAFIRIPFLKSIGLSHEMNSGLLYLSFLSVVCLWAVISLLIVWARKQKTLHLFSATQTDVTFLLLLCIVFSIAYLFWMRSIDLLWPLLVLLAAKLYAYDPTFIRQLPAMLLPTDRRIRMFLLLSCGVLVAAQVIATPYTFLRDDASHSLSQFSAMNVVQTGSRVLNLDWDYFFMYVALRPDLTYAAGIDRTFTYLTDPTVADTMRTLAGTSSSHSEAAIRGDIRSLLTAYPSDVIVASKRSFPGVIAALRADPAFAILSASDSIVVFIVPNQYRR